MALIVDASVAIAWAVEAQANQLTRKSLIVATGEGFLAPHHFPIEVANGLLRAERHERASRNENDIFLLDLKRMRMTLDEPIRMDRVSDTVALARRYMLSGYAAAYLELALRTKLPLATRDKTLAAAAEKSGAILFKG